MFLWCYKINVVQWNKLLTWRQVAERSKVVLKNVKKTTFYGKCICSSLNIHLFQSFRGGIREEDQDKRKKEEEKSGQNNYYVHCRWNLSPFSAGVLLPKCFHFRFLYTSAYCHRNRVSVFYLWLNIAPNCADAGGWWESGPPGRISSSSSAAASSSLCTDL